jgi:hypothetical protein
MRIIKSSFRLLRIAELVDSKPTHCSRHLQQRQAQLRVGVDLYALFAKLHIYIYIYIYVYTTFEEDSTYALTTILILNSEIRLRV